jgi:pilus assembly protein CpaB
VLVATRDLPPGARVPPGALRLREVPARFVPPGALGSAAGVTGARPAVPVVAGSYVTASLFENASEAERTAGGLGRGERAVTVEVSGVTGLGTGAGGVPPGTRVDVLVSTESATASGRTRLALADVELLRLAPGGGDDPEAPPTGSGPTALATLRVTLAQAIYLTEADNFAREIRLLARPPRG